MHRSSVEATFSDFPFPAGRHPKGPVYALHHNRQAASKELSAPLTFTHPSLIVLQCSFWGEGTKGMSSIQLFEWARSVARNTLQTVSCGQWPLDCHHGHGGARDHSWSWQTSCSNFCCAIWLPVR